EFNHAIRSLLSATLDSNDIGQVNPFDGVRLMGYIEFDDRGQLISGRSFIRIEVHDSFVGQVQDGHRIEPIVIQVPVTAARFVSGYQFEVRAEDQHGWILLQGIDQYGRFVGQLSFRNTNGRWGEGLSFEIETCGFFRCHK
ncbi:MAG: hypothetical protein NZ480_09880, partial [Bdellovibrionaceae bacterium]|nr:hypothetical protein [Pseudobdellovibrionaceae bacterium]MDW8190565.1 hypothetical protein [Pseudobdellovibrionaceae bacterium]